MGEEKSRLLLHVEGNGSAQCCACLFERDYLCDRMLVCTFQAASHLGPSVCASVLSASANVRRRFCRRSTSCAGLAFWPAANYPMLLINVIYTHTLDLLLTQAQAHTHIHIHSPADRKALLRSKKCTYLAAAGNQQQQQQQRNFCFDSPYLFDCCSFLCRLCV